jgi:hypothetical protein
MKVDSKDTRIARQKYAPDMKSLFFPCFCFTLENIQLRKVEFSELKPFALAEVEDL